MDQTIPPKANENQVGGKHYHQEYQHWDWAEDVELGAMEYAATKYVCRWRKKDGLQGLMKSVHYIEKLKELYVVMNRRNRSTIQLNYADSCTLKFVTQSQSTQTEENIYNMAVIWRTPEDLNLMIHYINMLIAEAQEVGPCST